jgi:chromosomal replication initiator protein
VGEANRLAFTAATRLADPDAPPAPVFIHGVCGVGKTHLVQGAANLFLERCPGAKVRYVTGETFTNDFVQAIKTGRVDQFRKVYRDAALLVIDDVHFLTNKDATQQELLHTFDTLGLGGSRILLASDEHPREILKLSEKLVSRFMSGAVVRIDAPDPALRRALIRTFALRRSLSLDDDAVEVLAQRSERATGSLGGFGGSVRELEGLLNQVEALARLAPTLPGTSRNGGLASIGADLVRRALGLEVRQVNTSSHAHPRRPIPVQTIVEHVCRSLHVDLNDFTGRGRHKRVVFARSVAAQLSRELTTQSFPEIARGMGRTNHSTIITAQRRLQRQIETRPHDILSGELAPMHPGMTLVDFLRSLASSIRQAAR